MKKFSTYLVVILSILLASSVQAAKKEVVVAMEATYPPFESIEGGKFVGFDIDLITTIANNLGYTIVFKDMQFGSIFPALNSGKVDLAISGITITDDRKKSFNFTVPYIADNISAVIYKNSGLITTDSLKGKKVCVQLGTTNEIWVKKNLPTAEISSMDSAGQCIEALNSKQVDATIINSSQIKPYLNNYPNLQKSFTIATDENLGILFPKKSAYYKEFNEELKKLISDGTVDKLIKKWM